MSFEDYEKEVYTCAECGHTVENPKENEDGDPVHEKCYTKTLDDLDLPVWVEMESYQDDYQLWRAFYRKTGVDEIPDDLKGDMKYAVFYAWYKITEDGVEGPYTEKEGEKMYK